MIVATASMGNARYLAVKALAISTKLAIGIWHFLRLDYVF